MSEHDVHARLAAAVDGVGGLETDARDPFVVVEAGSLVEALTFLRDDDGCRMEMLHNVTVVERDEQLEVVYHVCSYALHQSLVVKVVIERPDGAGHEWIPEVPSAASVYPSADWHEREQWDLLGVRFAGHPDHRRILLPEEWIGHPLRKDYVYPSAAGDIPLELDAVPIYERESAPPEPVREPRPAGTPLVQPPAARSDRPHAGGEAPPPDAKKKAAPKKKAAAKKDDGDAQGDGGKDAGGGDGKSDMAARIAAIKARKAKGDDGNGKGDG